MNCRRTRSVQAAHSLTAPPSGGMPSSTSLRQTSKAFGEHRVTRRKRRHTEENSVKLHLLSVPPCSTNWRPQSNSLHAFGMSRIFGMIHVLSCEARQANFLSLHCTYEFFRTFVQKSRLMVATRVFDEIVDFLTSCPAPEDVVAFKPSASMQSRADALLEKKGRVF